MFNQPNNLTRFLPQQCFPSSIGVRGGYPYVQYEKDTGVPSGYYWRYGEPILLAFDLEGELTDEEAMNYQTVSDFATQYPKSVILYDFRGRALIERLLQPEDPLEVLLTPQESLMLVPGAYRLAMYLHFPEGTRLTLIGQEECNITVI